jgi:hypothetical protein
MKDTVGTELYRIVEMIDLPANLSFTQLIQQIRDAAVVAREQAPTYPELQYRKSGRTLFPHVCLTLPELGIVLVQTGVDAFRVEYGKDHRTGDYSDAAKHLGCAIFHALACSMALDNRQKGERH